MKMDADFACKAKKFSDVDMSDGWVTEIIIANIGSAGCNVHIVNRVVIGDILTAEIKGIVNELSRLQPANMELVLNSLQDLVQTYIAFRKTVDALFVIVK